MEKICIVPLLIWGNTERLETLEVVVERVEAGAPPLVGERWIGDDEVESLERVAVHNLWVGQSVALLNAHCGIVMKDHVHSGETTGGGVLLLPIECDRSACFVTNLQEQRPRAACGVIDSGGGAGFCLADTDDFCNDAADLRRGVKLTLALPALGCKVAHEIFIGVAKDVIAVRPVLGKVERRIFKYGNKISKTVDHFFTAAELGRVVKIRFY